MVFVDLPGLLDPGYLLQRSMRELALDGLRDVDLVLFLHPASEAPAPDFKSLVPDAPPFTAPVLAVYTKGDTVPLPRRMALAAEAPVTAINDPDLDQRLLAVVEPYLRDRPFEYPADDLATQPTRFFVTEYLREAAFDLLEDELPYAFAAEVDEFRESPKPIYIRATLYVERESQKGIVIGQGGSTFARSAPTHGCDSRRCLASRSISKHG